MHGLHQVRPRRPPDPIIPKGHAAPKGGLLRAWAYALALVVFCLPLYSPDLFWHLSAGRWILSNLSVPRVDPFSFTADGRPWIDFEWLTQAAWFCVHRLGGLWALWALKIVLLAAAFLPADGLLRDRRAGGAARAGALALWLSAALAQADLRADLVSAAFFAWLLRRLESGRASFLFGFGLFALWANLHGGFVLGLGLYALAALAARAEKRAPPAGLGAEAAGALLGCLLNPYGAGLFRVIAAHASDPAMARYVMEWRAPSLHNPFQAALFAALAATAAALALAARRTSKLLLFCAVATGAASLLSARFGIYFAAASVAAVFTAVPEPKPALVAAGLAAVSALLVPSARRLGRPPFDDVYVARRAADFAVRERSALSGLRLFNQYEWGGYLGWALGPDGRVFGDGRYLFHSQLSELQAALESPGALADFAARRGLGGFLIRNAPARILSERVSPDGSRQAFERPWHVFFFPRERWALVYWDDQALLFVDRAKAPPGWLAAHEYRWLRPGDDAARADALARGEIPPAALAAETERHRAEVPIR